MNYDKNHYITDVELNSNRTDCTRDDRSIPRFLRGQGRCARVARTYDLYDVVLMHYSRLYFFSRVGQN